MGLRYYNCATAARTRLARLHLCRRLFPWKLPDTPSPYVNKGVGLPSRQLLAVKSRIDGKGLLVIYLTSVIACATPIQLPAPSWYLAICSGLVNNGLIIILALLALSLAVYWDPGAQANRSFAWPLLWISRLSTTAFALVVVMQLVAAGFFCQQVLAQNSTQLSGLERQLGVVVADVEAAQDPAQLNLILQRLGSLPIPPSAAQSEPLPVRKQQLLNVLQSNLRTAEGRLGQQSRQRFLALATDSVRVVVSALALAAACQGFAQWNGTYNPRNEGTGVVG
jgi:hypothetical protein